MDSNLTHSIETQQRMSKTVKELMLCRVIILTLLLVITFVFQIYEERYFFIPLTNNFYYFISLFYLATIFYSLLLKKITDLRRFAFVQIAFDQLFITGLIYFTGGKESFFPIVYIFSIIGSSIIFYTRGAFLSASLSTLLYGFLLLLQQYQWINPLGQPPATTYEMSQVFYSLVIYMATFYIVAFLSSYISEDLKRKKTELIQKQADYNQLENFNRNIIRSLDSGLLTIDLNGKINFFNPMAEKILNLDGTVTGEVSIYDLFPTLHGVVDEIRKKGESSFHYERYEMVFQDRKGRKVHLGFSTSPLTDPEGSLIGYTLIFQDITKFKDLEEQMKRVDKMAAVGLLAAGLAHEIRNPLASLSGSIQVLNSELVLDDRQQHLMEITLRESERLNALITDFLLFAQPPQSRRKPSEMGKILEETLELFLHSPSYHEGIRIIDRGHKETLRAMIDPDQMKQVFWNLLINAAQSLVDGGEIRINSEKWRNLSVVKEKKGKEWVKISISDSGQGIPPQDKEKIFEPFFTTKEGGTGLGLSIVHRIVENHNGMIRVESEIGKGSTFTVFLPAN